MDQATLKNRIGDHVSALQDLMPFAERADAEAQHGLGPMCYNGDGVPQDFLLARVWINVAAVNGHSSAAGVCYAIPGKIFESDLATAEKIVLRYRQQGSEYCVR